MAGATAAAEPFSIRGFAARMRSVDASKCHPFGGGCEEGEEEPPPPLPPMEPPPRSRWWAHELAAARARLSACDAAADGGRALVLHKGTKRKGSRLTTGAGRAKKRRRVLQFRSLLKNKEKTSKPPSTSRLHQHMLHMGLLRKQKSSIHSRRELAVWKNLEEAPDHLLPHENSLTHEIIERMDSSSDMHSSLSRRKEVDFFVNEPCRKFGGSINYPLNTTCEVVRHAAGARDDIFGDLPLLESSKVIFQTGGDELPTVIEESFITDQSDLDAEPETISLELINAYDITAQTSPLDDLVKIEETPDKEPICISEDDVEIDCLPNRRSTSMAKNHGDMHLKYSGGPALNSYSDLRSKCSSNNPPHGCFDINTNCSEGTNKDGKSSAITQPLERTRTEATNCERALVTAKKSTDVSGPAVTSNNLLLYQGNVLPYAVSQGVIDSRTAKYHLSSQRSVFPSVVSHARAYTNEMASCRSMPASTSSAASPTAVGVRTETTNYKDVPIIFKNTNITGPLVASTNRLSYQNSLWPSTVSQGVVNTRTTKNNLSSEGIVLPSAVPQGVGNARTAADKMTSCRSVPANECVPTSRYSGNVTSNVCHESRKPLDACTGLSTEKQDTWYSKLHPIHSPASIGLAFMKLPGLERMEISSCNVKTGEKKRSMNEQSLNTVRCRKQQSMSSMTNVMQGQKNVGFSHSQARKTVLDGCVGQDVPHPQQSTMRLMGKTVSVCKRIKDHSASNIGKVCSDNITTEATPLTANPCQFLQKKSLPYQDFAIPRGHLNNSSDFVARIASNTLSGPKTAFNGVQNQRLQPVNSVSSTAKDCTWNFGSQFVRPAECNKASMVSASEARHVELHQPANMASIPRSAWSEDDHNVVGPAMNQSSPIPQGLLKSSMKEKYQKSNLLCYDDPSSAPISQPYQISGTKLPCASIISFFDHGSNNFSGPCPSRTSNLPNTSASASGRTCMGSLTNTNGRMVAGFANQINNGSACADNVSQQPAKGQLVTDRHDFTSISVSASGRTCMGSFTNTDGRMAAGFVNQINNRPACADNVSQQPAKRQLVTDRHDFTSISVSASGRTSTSSITNTDGRMVAGFANQINNRPACADNVSQQPAKTQLITDRHDFTSIGPNTTNHSLGWSLDDAVGPQILDFRNKVAGDATQAWKDENNNPRVSSGSVPAAETRWRGGLVTEAKTTLKPGQNLNDLSKLLYPATFSVDNGVNSVVL